MDKAKKLYPFKFEANTQVLDENAVISNGFLAENSIDDIIDTYLEEFLGNAVFQYYRGIFPVKVSVNALSGTMPLCAHPDNYTALERYEAWGKAKMWYVTKASSSAKVFLGFKKEITAGEFYTGCLDGSIIDSLYSYTPKAGDCIYIKPGLVYGTTGDIELIEVSQNSEVTYHLTNDMEVAEAIDVINYSVINPEEFIFEGICGNVTIVNNSHFIVKSIELGKDGVHTSAHYASGSFKVYVSLAGKALVVADGKEYELAEGEMSVVPCGVEEYKVVAVGDKAHLLEISMPELTEADMEDLYLNYYEDESDYPTGSGTDPEEDECDCEDEHHHHCGCDCEEEHHHHHHCNHNHNNAASGEYVYRNPFEAEDDSEDDNHIGQRFFKH